MEIEILRKSKGLQALKIKIEAGEIIPLHDHPQTHVFMMVLKGRLKVRFFSYVENTSTRKTIREEFCDWMEEGDHQLIQITECNLHSIEAELPTEFIDIMSPGYFESDTPPNWYEVINTQNGIFTLRDIPQPEPLARAKHIALAHYEMNFTKDTK